MLKILNGHLSSYEYNVYLQMIISMDNKRNYFLFIKAKTEYDTITYRHK
jgi:hypothetical protein